MPGAHDVRSTDLSGSEDGADEMAFPSDRGGGQCIDPLAEATPGRREPQAAPTGTPGPPAASWSAGQREALALSEPSRRTLALQSPNRFP